MESWVLAGRQATGLPFSLQKFMQSHWFAAQPVLLVLPSHHSVSPSTLGHSAPWLGEGSVALAAHSLPNAAVLTAPHRAVSAGGPWELVSLGQSSSHTRPCAGTALTLPFASGNGRWEAWKFPQSRNIAFWAARRGSHPVPRQSQPWLGTAGSLSARLDYQPQRCPLDGKHLVCLAPAAAICCLGRVAQGSGSILNKFQL